LKNLKRSLTTIIIPTLILIICLACLKIEGRSFFSNSGKILFWVGDVNSPETSQQICDPYSFTHILHGVVFFWILLKFAGQISLKARFILAFAFEAIWEIIENSEFVIKRYREATISLGYEGDTILNSISDIVMCSIGFWIAHKLGLKRSLLFFVIIEIFLILWVKDSLCINIIMLIYPIESIKTWQAGL
jgi:hypothetical protein